MPLSTCRSSTIGLPWLLGKKGSRRAVCTSGNQKVAQWSASLRSLNHAAGEKPTGPYPTKGKTMTMCNAVFPANRSALFEAHRYSAAIQSGDLLFVSGQVGEWNAGSAEPDINAQVWLAFSNPEATVAARGCTFDDFVDVTSFHTEPEHQFETVLKVKNDVFATPPYPTWMALGGQLACRL